MRHSKVRFYPLFLSTTVVWFMLDMLSKKWAQASLPFQTNTGIAFSIQIPLSIQIIGSVLLIGFLLGLGFGHFRENQRNWLLKVVLFGIIMGGAMGNLLDRVLQGYVTDFIRLKPFPVFNLADVGITVGLITLFLMLIVEEIKTNN